MSELGGFGIRKGGGGGAPISVPVSIANGGTNATSFTAPSGGVSPIPYFDGTRFVTDATTTHLGYDASTDTVYTGKIIISSSGTQTAKFINTATQSPTAGSGMEGFSDSGTAMVSGNRLGFYTLGGATDTSHTTNNSIAIEGFATENWNGTSAGAKLTFSTTANGGTTRGIALELGQDKSVKISNSWLLPTTAPTSGQVLGYVSSGVSGWVTAGSAIPQSNTIYVDSINGVDATTGRGDINTPYLTPEYALSNTTNTGTITATTTSSSATLTSVSSTTNILIGQYITGTGIPYNTIVVSKTSNTIVLSKTCTASATITATWYTPYTMVLNGEFVASGSWQKQGFFFDCLNSNISFGAFSLFNLTASQLVPFVVIGGNWFGTSASSRFLNNPSSFGSSANFIFKPVSFYSIGTGYSIEFTQNGVTKFNNFTLECPNYICAFGSIANFESTGVVNISGYFYSLLQGFLIRYCTFNAFGKLESPSSVNIINNTQSAIVNTNAVIVGSMASAYGVYDGNIYGTTLTTSIGGNGSIPCTFNGNVAVTTFTNSGHAIINGQMRGNVVNNGTLGNIVINEMIGNYTGSSSSKATIRGASDVGITFNATLTGTSELVVLDTRYMVNAVSSYSIASGCTLYNKGYFRGTIGTMAGNLINDGAMTLIGIQTINGILINNNSIELTRAGVESVGDTPTLIVSTGTYQQNGGKLICNVADSKSGLLRKTATGGKIQLIGQAYLKVANGLAPLQILSNTGTAQDVEVYSVVDNCAVGFRISNTFTDTTYGTAYAPNILVGGTMLEGTTYLL